MNRLLIDLATAAKEYLWLWDHRHGKSTQEIALREHLSDRRVRFGIARARSNEPSVSGVTAAKIRPPRLEPLFPILTFVPASACPHYGRMRRGSIFCCMVCHRSGMDGHPALERHVASEPKPEKKPPPPAKPKPSAKLTRKQKRLLMFGPHIDPPSPSAA
jgi:hypothetical protein